jgi:hypothetical protein
MDAQLSLLMPPAARRLDPPTCIAPSAQKLTDLHNQVLDAFDEYGSMTDEQLERLPQFSSYGPSTIRKRRSELYVMGRLMQAGEKVNTRGRRMIVWRLA